MSDLEVFSYIGQDVRTVLIDSDPWFVVADVARALNLSNPSMAIAPVDEDDLSSTEVIDSMGRRQTARVVNEAGLYELIFQSRKPDAREFRRWITHVVIPEIRQTGTYGVVAPIRQVPQDLPTALREFAAEIEAHERTKAELAEVSPRADAWNAIASAEGDYSVSDAAKMLVRAGIPTGPQRLFGQLSDLRWTYRGHGGAWRAYAERVEKGYLTERPQFHYHPKTGERVIDEPQIRVTLKGIDRLRQRLHVGGLKAVTA